MPLTPPLTPPLKARAHGLVHYGFGVAATALPVALGLGARTKALAATLALTQGAINALTDTPVGVAPMMTLRTHGWLEAAGLPPFLAVPFLTGGADDTADRVFWIGLAAALAAAYTLTDWEAPADS